MQHLKRIFQWFVGIVVGLYLTLSLLMLIPVVQHWLAAGVASVLEDVVGSRVEIGRVMLNWNGRVVMNDVVVDDQQGEEMLRVARLAARPQVRALIHKRIRIDNVQLFGIHANLYQQTKGEAPNFRFFIDAFASKDTTSHTSLDLAISQVLVRRGHMRWQQRWRDDKPWVVADLNVTANLRALTDDSINVRLKRLDARILRKDLEANQAKLTDGGRDELHIEALHFDLEGNRQRVNLNSLQLKLPHSELEIPLAQVWPQAALLRYEATINGHVAPADVALLVPMLTKVTEEADVKAIVRGTLDEIEVEDLLLREQHDRLKLMASAHVGNLRGGKDQLEVEANISRLEVESSLLRPYVKSEWPDRVGKASLQGQASWVAQRLTTDLQAVTPIGKLTVAGNLNKELEGEVKVSSDGLQLDHLLANKQLGLTAFSLQGKGRLKNPLKASAQAQVSQFNYKGHLYTDIAVNNFHINGSKLNADLSCTDPQATLSAKAEVDLKEHAYKVLADVETLAPNMLNLTDRWVGTHFAGQLFADVRGTEVERMSGIVHLNNFCMKDSVGTYRPGDIHLTARPQAQGGHWMLISPFLEAQVATEQHPASLYSQLRRMVSNYLPSTEAETDKTPTAKGWKRETASARTEKTDSSDPHIGTEASFTIKAYSAEPLRRLLGIPVKLQGTTIAYGEMDSENNALWVNVTAPSVEYGKERLRNINARLESNYESMLANIDLQRMMKQKWVKVGMDTRGFDGKLATRIYFSNQVEGEPAPPSIYAGDVSLVSELWRSAAGKQGFRGDIMASNFLLSDTLWSVHPASVSYYDGALQIDSLELSQGDRFIRVNGRASKEESDTLRAELKRINLEYVFSLVNFHAVELIGEATGRAEAYSLFSSPKADAYVNVPNFVLNEGVLGDLNAHINWGQRPYSIYLNGKITDEQGERVNVDGYITPKKDISYHGLDLNIKTDRANVQFLNKWTSQIFTDIRGSVTGWVRVFGPFKQVNLEGDALVNETSLGVPFVGVRYHLQNDSVQLRPDNIYFSGAHLYDPYGNPGTNGHQAIVDGHLHHDSFKNLTYDISIDGNNILGYNFQEFGDQNFYGTVLATGNVTLKGKPGEVHIGIKARPEQGTTFTYNATSPDKLTETSFITYKRRTTAPFSYSAVEQPHTLATTANAVATHANTEQTDDKADVAKTELYMDFDLDIDEHSTMNLLMDARSGDKISLNGAGHMLAHYYSKGSFDLFGTYRVARGTYNLSLQEVIHKKFDFSPDGTITFNGEPYGGDLNLQAVHTVSGVSLNDINPKANFSNTTTRVNCLMNITGKASSPHIAFDFDIPNANDEEKQMVRSLISTEEERNMQVVYLLGIGRFYAYDYTSETQTQGTLAMNSLLASTLSGTINQALTNMIGSQNWNFGANLRTGELGWSNVDVEGMLSGQLLNNRLLINGNFGYRDNPVATSNFVGDFDVKYLLTPSGTVALKAYSETNDRYFTKSSLTTQGVGVILKKDFTTWNDLVPWHNKKNKRNARTRKVIQTELNKVSQTELRP